MTVSPHQVLRAAALARIPVTTAEAERMCAELDALPALGGTGPVTERPVPFAGPGPERARFRDAGALPDPLLLPPEAVAPEWRDGFFLVPHASTEAKAPRLDSPGILLPNLAAGGALDGPALAWRPVSAETDAVEGGRASEGGE
ncbi:MAG: hypothetical protein JWM27_29 [Gemmatimonadetes bacterium]|nr:hypothetical protein [Gemmatimonadota bacterium]